MNERLRESPGHCLVILSGSAVRLLCLDLWLDPVHDELGLVTSLLELAGSHGLEGAPV